MFSKGKKNIKLLNRVIILVLLFVCIFLFKGCYISEDNGYKLEFDSIDKGIEYQIFYTTETEPDFSEKNSVKIQTSVDVTSFVHYEINIPLEEKIVDFRIDFGTAPEEVKFKDLALIGNSKNVVDLSDIVAGFNGEIESYQLIDDFLKIYSSKSDPNSIIKGLNCSPSEKVKINYSDLVDLCIMYFMGVGLVWYLYKKFLWKKIKRYGDVNKNQL